MLGEAIYILYSMCHAERIVIGNRFSHEVTVRCEHTYTHLIGALS